MLKEELIKDIDKYISHLNKKGLHVTVHAKGIGGLLKHNIHSNSFCSLVKTDISAWEKCIHCQQRVFKEYKSKRLFGMCYAGMEEYVFFIDDKIFVSVSGYGIDKEKAFERIGKLSENFYLNKAELLRVYENSLKHEKENIEELNVIIKPLCHMLRLLQMMIAEIPLIESKNTMLDTLLAYVQYNFMQDITLCDIAQACACSESTVCHLFKEYMGLPIKKYIVGLRISQAEKLLKTTDLSIGTIAQMCGFSNINYFPTAFKKHVGISPTEYRMHNVV